MKILKEILWLVIAIIIAAIIQYPIFSTIDYKFIVLNSFIIILSVYYIRFILDFGSVTIFKNKWLRYAVFSFNLILFVNIIGKLQNSLLLFDVFSINLYSKTAIILDYSKEGKLIHYINTEFLFFGIVALISIIMLNMKLLKSYWSKKSIAEF